MKYQGSYNKDTPYNIGDVVVGPDNVAYHMLNQAAVGTDPKDTLYWNRLSGDLNEVVLMFHEMLESMRASIPTNVGDTGIVLKSTDDTSTAEYLVTIDDSGEDPEVVATLIETEGGES